MDYWEIATVTPVGAATPPTWSVTGTALPGGCDGNLHEAVDLSHDCRGGNQGGVHAADGDGDRLARDRWGLGGDNAIA
jgi:hypothetical protein